MSAVALSWGLLAIVLVIILLLFIITLLFSFAGIVAIVRGGFSLVNALALIFFTIMWASCLALNNLDAVFGFTLLCWLLGIPLCFINFSILFTFIILIFYSCVYCIVPKRKDVKYIIILGAAIIVDKPSPLLQNRLDAALKTWDKGGRVAKFVCSGGQGKDEIVSEASVMAEYLRQKGVQPVGILLEDRSKNTLESMKYSKVIIETDACEMPVCCLFVTNNFHVLRSAFHARRMHLDAEGLGCKTAFWYWPSVFVREYMALFVRYRPKFLLVGFAVLCVLLFASVPYIRSYPT